MTQKQWNELDKKFVNRLIGTNVALRMLHRGCGGVISEDASSLPYHYNPDTDTANSDDPEISVYRCAKCEDEILGDATIVFDPPIDEPTK